ncbi:MAG: DUF4194 domain-containing protein [Verrucomicrobiota bacterium]
MQEEPTYTNDSPVRLLALPESERERLGEALQALLSTGSINGLDAGRTALYHWCRQYFEWLREIVSLAGLDVAILHEERLIQAIPRNAALRLRLRQDATLVWLALWYAGDVRWRDEGQDQAFLSVAELIDLIHDQLMPDAAGPIPRGRLREILRQAASYNLIRFEPSDTFEESGIEVLPAIRRIIPFRDLATWTATASAFDRETNAVLTDADEETIATEEDEP